MGRMSVNAGGGGADLDAITAGAEDIVSPKVGLDNEGEPLAGTLKDNSGVTKSAAASLDATNSRVQLTVPETGKYSLTSKLYATYATIRSLIGLTADKLWTGVTILGLKSSRNALAAKTWTPGTANQTIAAGTCVTGAQTIKGDSNLKAANIKKGVSIFGIKGTWEGYVASPTDLYYYGQNKCGLSSNSSDAEFQDTQVLIGYNSVTFTTNAITFTGYSKLNFLVQPCGVYSENTPIGVDISKPFSLDTEVSGGDSTTQKTISVPLSNFQSAGSLTFRLTNIGSTKGRYGKLLRIWLS